MAPATSSSRAQSKRRGSDDESLSPPPLKRKAAQSNMTKGAVANFFTPASKKPKDRTTWSERAPEAGSTPTLLVGRYEAEGQTEEDRAAKRRKIAAFDLDSTLITTSSGKRHSGDATDWKWWDTSVRARLRRLYSEGYRIVVLTNQGGLTLHPDPAAKAPKNLKDRVADFKQKCSVVLAHLDLPLTVYAATGKDVFRKPRTGMWEQVCRDYGLDQAEVDLQNSFFVGDAGGRVAHIQSGVKGVTALAKDFSCSDRNLAHNVGIRYETPEEFFQDQKPREFARDFDLSKYRLGTGSEKPAFARKNDKDIVLFCGPPGAGKSTFYWKVLEPLEYERVNQDILKSKDKCFKAAAEHLSSGRSVAIDATNADPDTRSQWVDLASKHKVPIRCVWFKTPLGVAEHNDVVRALNKSMNPESREILPKLAFNGFNSRFREPKLGEGFQDIWEVEFEFRGTEEEYAIWGKYWL